MEPIVELTTEEVDMIAKKVQSANELVDGVVEEDMRSIEQLAMIEVQQILDEEEGEEKAKMLERMEQVIRKTILLTQENANRRLTMRVLDMESSQHKVRVQHESMSRLMSLHVNTRADYYAERMAHTETKEKLRLSRNRNAEYRRRLEAMVMWL